jgi:septum site-determining protein MinC
MDRLGVISVTGPAIDVGRATHILLLSRHEPPYFGLTLPQGAEYPTRVSQLAESRFQIRVRGRSFMALVLAPEAPADEWLAALDVQIQKSPSFFDGRPVIVDLAVLPREQPNVAGLIEALRQRGIRVIGTEGAHPSWPGLEKLGPPLSGGRAGAKPIDLPTAPPAPLAPAQEAVTAAPSAPTAAPQAAATLVVDHSVRSGQSVISEHGDVVVIGSVASGAEIMAGGSIHVYGTLRGRAVAGVSGNGGARIFCSKLQAELLAIDGLYRTADDVEPALKGRAVMAWLDGQAMKIEPVD